jgi:serine protease
MRRNQWTATQEPENGAKYQPRIAVKLRTDHPVLNQKAAQEHLVAVLEQAGLMNEFGALEVLPLFESFSPASLTELVDQAQKSDPSYEPVDLLAWFQVVSRPDVNVDALAKRLWSLPEIETGDIMRPTPPPVNPADDPRSPNQGYLDPAPVGVDARFAWGVPVVGSDGAGVGFVDLEQGWNLHHEDLAAAGITLISGVNHDFRVHGTCVLGQVLMVDDNRGGVGIAPSCNGRVISQWRPTFNTADAIVDAARHMAPGDVLLLEAQEQPHDPGPYFPVEIADSNYDAIRAATALGIVVVEAAGNGNRNLDTYSNASGKKIFDRSSPHFRDSRAIMVGAAFPTTRSRWSPRDSGPDYGSNYGSRIDCYAWGDLINTTTTNNAGTNNIFYTKRFGGTSGASAIVAGAAVIVQALAQTSLGRRFDPITLRGLLVANGTRSARPAKDRIGVMPNLRALIIDNLLGAHAVG